MTAGRDPEAWAVPRSYLSHRAERVDVDPVVVEAILDAMGAADDAPPPAPAKVIRQGDEHLLKGFVRVVLEQGDAIELGGAVPHSLPLGYHVLTGRDGLETPLIVGPRACYLPDDLRAWGWGVQLYSTRALGLAGVSGIWPICGTWPPGPPERGPEWSC